MDRLNLVILSDEVQLKVDVKNKIEDESMAIVGYADFEEGSKLKIQGYFPDVLICAVRDKVDDEVFDFINSMHLATRGCSVVMMTDKITVSLMNRAAQVGIRQVLDLKMDNAELASAIHEVFEYEKEIMDELKIEKRVRSKVISFFSAKGGVGLTTIAVNTAACLSKQGRKVLMLDFDLQCGDINLALDVDPKDTIVELVQDPEGISIERINAFSAVHSSGITVLCAPKSPELAEYIKPRHITQIIENARPYFEYIFIDLPSDFNDCTVAALEGSDEIFIVNNPDILSLKSARVAYNLLEQLNQGEKIRLIMNRNSNSLIKVKDFESTLERPMYASISHDYKSAVSCINLGQPFVLVALKATVTKEVQQLAAKIEADKIN